MIDSAIKARVVTIQSNYSIAVKGETVIDRSSIREGLKIITKKPEENKIQFDGTTWMFQFGGTIVHDVDRVGWHYVQQLVQQPGCEIHVTKLVSFIHGEAVDVVDERSLVEDVAVETRSDDEGGDYDQVVETIFSDEILPDENRDFVYRMLEDKYKHLASLNSKGNPLEVLTAKEGIQEIESEITQIKAYLNKHRFQGKNSCFPNRTQIDRKSVAKAIKEATKKITGKHPSLAEHFHKSIQTGEYCEYRPDQDHSWEVAIRKKSSN
jgi:hypothetical protein